MLEVISLVFAYLLKCLFILDRVCGFVHMQFTSYHNKFFIVVQFDSIVEAGFFVAFRLKGKPLAREFETDASSSYGRD